MPPERASHHLSIHRLASVIAVQRRQCLPDANWTTRLGLQHRSKGVCVVLSDFFDKGGYENGLRYVAGGKYDLFAVQVLSPQEIDPDIQGDLKLRDMEDDDLAEVSITQPLMKQYKANLNAYCLAVKDYVTRRGGTYLFTSTAVPFDTLVLNYLRERGLLG